MVKFDELADMAVLHAPGGGREPYLDYGVFLEPSSNQDGPAVRSKKIENCYFTHSLSGIAGWSGQFITPEKKSDNRPR